jgi:hypothetical protein
MQKEGIDMRHIMVAIALALGVSFIGMAGASATPANGNAMLQSADQSSVVTQVAGGCGRGWHRGPHGHCRRNHW